MNSTTKVPAGFVVSYSFMSDASDLASQVDRFLDREYQFYESPPEMRPVEVEDGPECGMVSLCDSIGLHHVYTAQSNCRNVYFVDSVQRLAVRHGSNAFFWRKRQGKGDFIIDATGLFVLVDDFLRERGVFEPVVA